MPQCVADLDAVTGGSGLGVLGASALLPRSGQRGEVVDSIRKLDPQGARERPSR
jgi:hypothetical protein